MRETTHPSRQDISLIEVMKAFGDPIRMGVVRVLSDGQEHGWGELRAPVAKSTLSHHLHMLRAAGITRTRMEGTRCYVRLRRDDLDQRFPGLIDALLAAAGQDDVGSDVALSGASA